MRSGVRGSWLPRTAVEQLVATRGRDTHAHAPLARDGLGAASPPQLAVAVVVVEHVHQRHEHAILVLIVGRRAAVVAGEAARLVREVRPHPRLGSECCRREERWVRGRQHGEERRILRVKVLPPASDVLLQLGAELRRLPCQRRAVRVGQRVRIRAPPPCVSHGNMPLVDEVAVEDASPRDHLQSLEMFETATTR